MLERIRLFLFRLQEPCCRAKIQESGRQVREFFSSRDRAKVARAASEIASVAKKFALTTAPAICKVVLPWYSATASEAKSVQE